MLKFSYLHFIVRIIAVNYCAKYYGISREDNCKQAMDKCPQVKVVKKESRLIATGSGFIEKAEVDHLIKSSQNVLDAFVEYRKKHGLSVILENVSNDETYFDLTEEVDKRIRKQIVDSKCSIKSYKLFI
jgi:nucleotidyltransferase/DNA polymerase involved in DNA repair